MTTLVDVVNFNADASCLSVQAWLAAMQGGDNSAVCSWLRLYVDSNKKVTLGLVGSAVADLAELNPQALALINANPEVFEMLLRPFSHDVALLRLPRGFDVNISYGEQVIRGEFARVTPFFLPPEFMLTNEQVGLLADRGVRGTFMNAARFKAEVANQTPAVPYMVQGLLGQQLLCVPVHGPLTQAYLDGLHMWGAAQWNQVLSGTATGTVCAWRDGESAFLLPDGLARERHWLTEESGTVVRTTVADVTQQHAAVGGTGYPVHSSTAWLREFRMLGFLQRIRAVEEQLDRLDDERLVLWLHTINSDVLSAVEKDSPVVTLRTSRNAPELAQHTIHRSNRGFEGEEYLGLLEGLEASERARVFLQTSTAPHMVKLRTRMAYLRRRKAAGDLG